MWIYSGNALRHRLSLDPMLGFWLDYWLFLHYEETHPIWCARPLGIRALAQAGYVSNGDQEENLRIALKQELNNWLDRLLPYVHVASPPANTVTLLPNSQKRKWKPEWLNWFENILQTVQPHDLALQIVDATATSLAKGNLEEAAFLTRRLAAEIGGEEWPERQLFNIAEQVLCNSGTFDGVPLDKAGLRQALTQVLPYRATSVYNVLLNLVPIPVSTYMIRLKNVPGLAALITEQKSEGNLLLTGLRFVVEATHPEQALAKALDQATTTLDWLRLRFYYRAHLSGMARVLNTTDSVDTPLELPQPFWSARQSQVYGRAVPSIPGRFDSLVNTLPESDREHWYAACWHLSQAFADWSEDPHGAAAKVWQALESYSLGSAPTKLSMVLQFSKRYLNSLPIDIAQFLANRVSSQAGALHKILKNEGLATDWYRWDSKRIDLKTWIGRVLNEKSFNYFANWKSPEAPPLVFDDKVGLIQITARRLRDSTTEMWMEERLENDLRLLYGLRNKVVHSGVQIFPQRMAMYLAQLGVEVILTIMNDLAKGVMSHTSGSVP